MRPLPLIAPALIAACSSPAPSSPVPTPASSPTAATSPATGTEAAPQSAPPQPGEVRAFRDWAVTCDNTGRCAMASLGGEGADFPPSTVELARTAGPGGGYEVALQQLDEQDAPPATILIDGARFAVAGDGLAGAAAARIARAMANGRAMRLLNADGGAVADVSLAGASAALRWIDERQGRVGTVTAAVARGDRPASTVPPPPAVPVVRQVPIGGAAPPPAADVIAAMRKKAGCETEYMTASEAWRPEAYRIADGAALVLVPCSMGAYNVSSALFVVDRAGWRAAETDAPAGFEASGAADDRVASVVNGAIDGGLLTSSARGRGLGDCGVGQSFAWDGRRLRLVEQTEMSECRGNPNWLRTWRVRVER